VEQISMNDNFCYGLTEVLLFFDKKMSNKNAIVEEKYPDISLNLSMIQ